MRHDEPVAQNAPSPRVIRRYENRKLYDTEAKRYVSLPEVAHLVQQGLQVRVVEHASGEDITAQTLMRIIAEQDRAGRSAVSTELLHDVVRWSGRLMTTSRDQVERGFNRFLQNMTDRLPSLQQARTEMNVLTAKIEGLEALVAELTQARAGADATKPATPPKE